MYQSNIYVIGGIRSKVNYTLRQRSSVTLSVFWTDQREVYYVYVSSNHGDHIKKDHHHHHHQQQQPRMHWDINNLLNDIHYTVKCLDTDDDINTTSLIAKTRYFFSSHIYTCMQVEFFFTPSLIEWSEKRWSHNIGRTFVAGVTRT